MTRGDMSLHNGFFSLDCVFARISCQVLVQRVKLLTEFEEKKYFWYPDPLTASFGSVSGQPRAFFLIFGFLMKIHEHRLNY